MKTPIAIVGLFALFGLFICPVVWADWPQFRGPGGEGLAPTDKLPLSWDAEQNVAWKTELPGRGPSSPIVVGGRVFVTCSDGADQERIMVVCIDADSGEQLWRREFWATGRTATHPTSAVAAPTPASDGQRIFAFFSSNDLICLDLDGNLLWYRGLAYDFPKAGNDVGMSSSPVVVGETVVVQIENQGDSFATGINTQTGETRWRLERDTRSNWASPIGIPAAEGRPQAVLLQSPNSGLTAHNPLTGDVLWKYEAQCSGIPSPLVLGNRILVASEGLTMLRLNPGSAAPERAWDESRMRPESASPIAFEDRVYVISSGVLKCADLKDGSVQWQLRLEGKYWATPVIANGHLYAINQDGNAKVVSLSGKKGEVVGEGKLEQTIQGTPAIAGNALFVRSDSHLWKISAPQ